MRTEWWAYFDRLELDDVERVGHGECIAELDHLGSEPQPKGGVVWHTYRFDPTQELKIRDGSNLIDPATEKAAGAVKEFDTESGQLILSRRSSSEAPHPKSLMVGSPPSPNAQEAAIRRMATLLLDEGPDAAGVGYRLLKREPPSLPQLTADALSDQVTEASERALALDGDFLAIQGPPGAGKTYTGARIIQTLIENGKTVAICANSHAVINHLLREVIDIEPDVRALKKGSTTNDLPPSIFTQKYAEIETALDDGQLDIFAGTAFALCREQFIGTIDTLVVEEAGQMSLANALATSQAAHNLILLGDPQQLNQPTKAAHPPGTNRSALFHLLDDSDTISAEMGMFLPETRRMHPSVTRFISERFYDGRLGSHPSCELQALDTLGVGLHLQYVPHANRSSSSPEEATAVHTTVESLLGQSWTNQDGIERKIELDDILVVAPYNAQVRELHLRLPSGSRVGTVDLFQGREAPIVIYSMASSSADLAPRGMDFLYDLHRLNVAVSRAQGAAIIVCSPALMRPACTTPTQVRLASALCRYAEAAAVTS